jgi:hypothetical protein
MLRSYRTQNAELQRKLAIIAQKREEQARAKAIAEAASEGGGNGGVGSAGAAVAPQLASQQRAAADPAAAPKSTPKPAPAPAPRPTPPPALAAKQLDPQQLLLQKQEEYMDQLRKMIAIKEAEQKAKGVLL